MKNMKWRRFRHADRRIVATVIRQVDKSGYVMLQTAQGNRISRSVSSLLANWIEENDGMDR